MMYRAASVTGYDATVLRNGLINPRIVVTNPIGKAKETTTSVSKLVSGAIKDTYPKCIAVNGKVRIIAPVVVARLDVI